MAPLVVGISGPTCSGKTTIAEYLKRIFPRSAVLHEDDFYLPAAQLPYRAGFQNWDCAAAIDQPRLRKTLDYVKTKGCLPNDFKTYQTDVQPSGVPETVVETLSADVQEAARRFEHHRAAVAEGSTDKTTKNVPDLLLVEGFLLFGKSMTTIMDAFDVRILLGGKYEDLKRRRDARTGYNTDEGFWKDPEGFFDLVVWPEYREEHGFLFKNQDVNGSVDQDIVQNEGIRFCPSEDVEEMLTWTVRTIMASLSGSGQDQKKQD